MIYTVVAVHDRKEYTERFLLALKQQTVQDIELVLVDDGSTDGSSEMALQHYPNAIIVRGPGNWWWTRSMQKGVEAILPKLQPGDYVLCANNDQITEPHAVAALLSASKKYANAKGGAIVGSISKKYDDPKQLFDSAYTIDWSMHIHNPVPLAEHGEYAGEIDVLTCRLTLLPMEVFKEMNFDGKRYPHYLGDYDLFLQAKKRGFKLVLSYDAVIFDVGGVSGNETKGTTLTLSQLKNNMFNVRSHNNVVFMARFFLYDCPNWFYKVKLLSLIFYYHLYLFVKAVFFSAFGWDIRLPRKKS